MRLMRGQGKCGDYHGARTLGCGGRGGGWVGGGWWRTHKIETRPNMASRKPTKVGY
jgi:hypothetical protein